MTTSGSAYVIFVPLLILLHGATGQRDGSLRLVDGLNEMQGRVEVYMEGEWGTVCDDYWGTQEAQVVCRQLGYNDMPGAEPHSYSHFGEGTGPIHLDNVGCSGAEKKLIDCPFLTGTSVDCSHWEDAGVSCFCLIEPECAIPANECIYGRTERVTVPHQKCPICRCASCPLQPRCPMNCKSGKTEYFDGVHCRRCRCIPQELPDEIVEPNDISVGMLAGVAGVALGLPTVALITFCLCTRKQRAAKGRPAKERPAAPQAESKPDNWFEAASGGQKPKAVAIF